MIKPDLTAPVDGRQSDRALEIQRGTGRLLRHHGFVSLPEVTLKSGRRADLLAINTKGEIWIVEIKSSLADFRADKKWPDYWDFCDRLFFATNQETPEEIFPDETGLIIADAHGAEIVQGCGTAQACRRAPQGSDIAICPDSRFTPACDPRSGCADPYRACQIIKIAIWRRIRRRDLEQVWENALRKANRWAAI